MARLVFSSFNNGDPMSNVRTIINNNFTNVAMAKPFDNSNFIDTNDTGVRLVAISGNGDTYALSQANVKKLLGDPLTVSNLTVTDDTKLGDNSAEDTVTISATVIGLGCNVNFSGGTITATHFIGGDFNGTSVHATIGDFDNLKVGGQPYRPFIISGTAPTGQNVQNRLWINTANNNIVPIIMYCDLDVSDTTTNASAGNWHPLGAVFG